MKDELEQYLIELENEGDKLISIGKQLLENIGMTEFSLFCTAILNRTINLNRGFITLINDSNYIAAAPLVRLNLDSLLRLFASSQSEFDYETFAQKVRRGEKISNLKDKTRKKKLKDFELVERLKEIKGLSWVDDVYKAGSGFVHLSINHINSSYSIDGEIMTGGIRKNDEFISNTEKIAAAHYMTQASRGIRVFIGDWINIMNKK
ncbi:hypothetical protein [Sunxiuqinia elliptica]|uniref:Uncharacterized protein n=1 Tax=Sunxiuqinia elliptica TaxID=655355 RepID=A0A1I2LU27_9BACT|nr:hypothetical protein [Sunxiuqinia elliptica]SFF81900.1 hypothetical protein SAMN05216283_1177 [Sunxiuqinia elliptica]